MRAITVIPGQQGSVALTDMPEPPAEDGPILVQTQAIGICGTDLEIINGEYGSAPPGQDRLIIGHESLGRVAEAAPGTGFGAGDLVVGIVRRRDPVPCSACAAGDWDMCMNGQYTERGIKGRHGYASERYRIHPDYLVTVDPGLGLLGVLLEPTTVVAKAWDHIEKIGHRAAWAPQTVLITGAGPIGLLAALLATQRGYQTYVLDRVTEGRKPRHGPPPGGHLCSWRSSRRGGRGGGHHHRVHRVRAYAAGSRPAECPPPDNVPHRGFRGRRRGRR